jgi:hypothetical protein
MKVTVTWAIDGHQISSFDTFLKECNGRYLATPRPAVEKLYISFGFDSVTDYAMFIQVWDRHCKPIVEVKKDQLWRKILRRIGVNI